MVFSEVFGENICVTSNKIANFVFRKPDFVIRKMKIAIFCNRKFWYGRNHFSLYEFGVFIIEEIWQRLRTGYKEYLK